MRYKPKAFFLVALMLFVALSVWRLATWSFWFDESYTSALVATNPSEVVTLTSADVHPPLYYLALQGWSQFFGASDFALRSLSLVSMVTAVCLTVRLLKKFVDEKTAYLAATVALFAPFTVRYAQEARMYAFASAIIAGSTLALVMALKESNRKRQLWYWGLYSLLIAAALYTHYFSGLVVIAHGLYVVFVHLQQGSIWNRLKAAPRYFYLSLLGSGVLYLPWMPTLLDQFNAVNGGFWIPPADAKQVVTVFSQLHIFRESLNNIQLWLVAISLVLVALGFTNLYRAVPKKPRKGVALLASTFLVPLVVLFIISILPSTTSYFYFRYFAQFSLMYYAALGVLLFSTYKPKHVRSIAMVLLSITLVAHSYGVIRVLSGADKNGLSINQDFKFVNEQYQDGDAIVTTELFIWFNARHYNQTNSRVMYLDEHFGYGSLQPIYRSGSAIERLVDIEAERVWLVRGYQDNHRVPSSWQQAGEIQQMKEGSITLYRTND